MITMLTKHNWSSYLYLIFFLIILTIGYYPHRVNNGERETVEYKAKAKLIHKWYGYLIIFTHCIILYEYVFMYTMWLSEG